MTVSETIQAYDAYCNLPWIPPCPAEGRTQWTKVEVAMRNNEPMRIWVNGRLQK